MDELIIYAKRPLPAYAKTRLGRGIGMDAAAGIYARLLYRYLERMIAAQVCEMTLSVASPQDVAFFEAAFPELRVSAQVKRDLGGRMWASLREAFARGAERAVLTGTDIPGLGPNQVQSALAALDEADLVLGPAKDGGYYLVGMRAPGCDVFRNIAWSTADVLTQTIAQAHAFGKRVKRIETLSDLDNQEDYERWRDCATGGA